MRWNETITLLSATEKYQDETGAWHEGERTARTVFCNQMIIGFMTIANLRSSDIRMANTTEPVDVGLRNEHMIQIRAIDYNNEDKCIFHDDEYEIMYLSGGGEYRVLTIAQRLGNSSDAESQEQQPDDDGGGTDGG